MDMFSNSFGSLSADAKLDELLEHARALRPILADRVFQTERDGKVSDEVTARLVSAGLYRLGQPKRFGGNGYPPSAMFKLGYELGRGCPSTAWCAMIANGLAWLISYWPLQAQEEIWNNCEENVVAGTFVPTGQCERADGGYRIRGRWPFASNCDHADWFFVSGLLPECNGSSAGPAWFLLPRAEIQIDHASWRVAGMQGTGSKTLFSNEQIFVPEHRALRFADIINASTPGRSVPDNPQADYNFATIGGVLLVAPILGAAQAALDWFVEAMRTKVKSVLKPGAPIAVADQPDAQHRAGEVQVRLDAAIALLLGDLVRFEADIVAGGVPDIDARIRMRRNIAFAAEQASTSANLLFSAAGAGSASLTIPMQMFWRDISVGANHASLDVQGIYRMVGRHMFGLPPMGAH